MFCRGITIPGIHTTTNLALEPTRNVPTEVTIQLAILFRMVQTGQMIYPVGTYHAVQC